MKNFVHCNYFVINTLRFSLCFATFVIKCLLESIRIVRLCRVPRQNFFNAGKGLSFLDEESVVSYFLTIVLLKPDYSLRGTFSLNVILRTKMSA